MNIKKMTLSAIFIAIGVSFATFMFFPMAYPVQHFVNMISAVLLGPYYTLANAFIISLLRNILGLGTLKAFPGSMFGALLAGVLYKKFQTKYSALIGEVFGTGILGAIASYPVVAFIVGQEAALFTFVPPFVVSSFAGAAIGYILLVALEKTNSLKEIQNKLK